MYHLVLPYSLFNTYLWSNFRGLKTSTLPGLGGILHKYPLQTITHLYTLNFSNPILVFSMLYEMETDSIIYI